MARKAITQVSKQVSSNLASKNNDITLLLKRMCTFEEAVDYLLSAIPEIHKDDMLGELIYWDANIRKLQEYRDKNR